MSSSSNTPIPFLTDRIMIGEPLPDATYTTDEELAQAYVSHSYDHGYGVVLADSQGMKRPNKLGRAVLAGEFDDIVDDEEEGVVAAEGSQLRL